MQPCNPSFSRNEDAQKFFRHELEPPSSATHACAIEISMGDDKICTGAGKLVLEGYFAQETESKPELGRNAFILTAKYDVRRGISPPPSEQGCAAGDDDRDPVGVVRSNCI